MLEHILPFPHIFPLKQNILVVHFTDSRGASKLFHKKTTPLILHTTTQQERHAANFAAFL